MSPMTERITAASSRAGMSTDSHAGVAAARSPAPGDASTSERGPVSAGVRGATRVSVRRPATASGRAPAAAAKPPAKAMALATRDLGAARPASRAAIGSSSPSARMGLVTPPGIAVAVAAGVSRSISGFGRTVSGRAVAAASSGAVHRAADLAGSAGARLLGSTPATLMVLPPLKTGCTRNGSPERIAALRRRCETPVPTRCAATEVGLRPGVRPRPRSRRP